MLLRTKLYIPSPQPGLVVRPRLLQRMGEGRRLTLVSAPAGFGKTTLLSNWLSSSPETVAWVSLDAKDNNPVQFWTYVVAALQTVDANVGQMAQHYLAANPLPAFEIILTALLNDLSMLPNRLFLVLDDYHAIETPSIHQSLAFVLEHAPRQLYLIIATRADPPLPLARWRARGQMNEIRAADLRFTTEEAATFFSTAINSELHPHALAALEERTEGWIAGLQLAALSMQNRQDISEFVAAFTGSHHYVLEYLTEEVLNRQPDDIQHFLLQTSVLERLCGPLCDMVTGYNRSNTTLEYLHQQNLFIIPLDVEHYWYRYHHLFADLLRNRLHREADTDTIAALHRRASQWYEQNNLPTAAITHALHAGDFERIVALIEPQIATSTSNIDVGYLMDWIEQLPDEIVGQHPWLSIFRAWALGLAGQFEAASQWLQAADDHGQDDYVRGNVAIGRAYAAERRGDMLLAESLVKESEALLPKQDVAIRGMVGFVRGRLHYLRGETKEALHAYELMYQIGAAADNVLVMSAALCEMAAVRKLQGRLSQAKELYNRVFKLATGGEQGQALESVPLADIGLGELLWQQNELEQAQQRLQSALNSLQQSGWWGAPADLLLLYLSLARVSAAQDNYTDALEWLTTAEQISRKMQIFPYGRQRIECCRAEIELMQGEIETTSRWSATAVDPDLPFVLAADVQIMQARLMIAQKQPQAVLNILETVDTNLVGIRVLVLALQAQAYQMLGNTDQALALMAESVKLADGQMRLDEATANLLQPFRHSPTIDMIDLLSERELEVLHLIGEGYSNHQIAEALVITLNTVKKHNSNLYSKLGVSSRTQAIVRAQELGLL